MGTRAHLIHRRARRPLLRPFLAAAALLGLASPALSSGCVASFEPISEIRGVRVLAVSADTPYAVRDEADPSKFKPVTFTIDVYPEELKMPPADPLKPKILWIGGCFNPPDDAYFACFPQLAEQFQQLASGDFSSFKYFGNEVTYTLELPETLISARPRPATGPHYGIAYVFFAACDGELRAIPPESSGKAGSFPLGCFDAQGKRLGAERFVPGYTQIYAFEDEDRKNSNPVVTVFKIDGETVEEGVDDVKVERCPVRDDQRDLPPSCSREDPYVTCRSYALDIDVPADVAEIDPESKTLDGKPLHEAVWVDYFAEAGSFESSVALVSDAVTGVTKDRKVKWLPPPEAGPVQLWAVVRDARGGSTVLTRFVQVE